MRVCYPSVEADHKINMEDRQTESQDQAKVCKKIKLKNNLETQRNVLLCMPIFQNGQCHHTGLGKLNFRRQLATTGEQFFVHTEMHCTCYEYFTDGISNAHYVTFCADKYIH